MQRAAELDWAQLLLPVSSAAPSGSNLEYSAEFAELELLARGTPDRHMGASLVPGQAPDPGAVLQRGAVLLRRTKDVRVFTYLLAACVPVLGIPAFVAGLSALHELLECFWDTVHPGLDPDDEAQATARASAVMACAGPELVLALRRSALIEARGSGCLSLEDVLLTQREPSAEGSSGAARLSSVLREQPPGELAALVGLLQAGLTHTTAIPALFAARSAAVPNLQALQAFFRDALGVLRQHRVAEAGHRQPGAPGEQLSTSASSADSSGAARLVEARNAPRNSITCRDDVREALEAICTYYDGHEPASPLPLLLRRCQRLVGLDFLATLRELAPEAVDKVVLLGGAHGETARPT